MALSLNLTKTRLTQANQYGEPLAGSGTGSVTSISQGNGITATPDPITTTGSIALGTLLTDWTAGNFNIHSRNSVRVFNVRAYGAVGDGATDDTAAIQAAIDAAGATNYGGIVYVPTSSSFYKVTTTLVMNKIGVALVGDQSGSTVWGSRILSTNLDVPIVTCSASGYSNANSIRDLTIGTYDPQAGNPLSGNWAIDVTGSGWVLQNLSIQLCMNGIRARVGVLIDNVWMTNFKNAGVTGGIGLYLLDAISAHVSNLTIVDGMTLGAAFLSAAIDIHGDSVTPDTLLFDRVEVAQGQYGAGRALYIHGSATYQPEWTAFSNCYFETKQNSSGIHCVDIAHGRDVKFSNSFFAGGENAVNISGGLRLSFVNCLALVANKEGIVHNSNTKTEFIGCTASGNGQEATDTYAGLRLGSSSAFVTVTGGYYGSGLLTGVEPPYQKYGIKVDAGASSYTVDGAKYFGNVTADTSPSPLNSFAVQLQASSPGLQQTGNTNLKGTMVLDGNLGVGTVTPAVGLHLAQAKAWARLENSISGAAPAIDLKPTAAGGKNWLIQTGDDASTLSGRLRVYENTTSIEPISILPVNGRVGILTTNPTSQLTVNGTVELVNGSGGGYKFADGSIQTTAVGVGGACPSSRLINTTAPLAGGGNLTADRTLSLAVTVVNDGGAVAKQAATPGTQQTGNINVSGAVIAGTTLQVGTAPSGTPVGNVRKDQNATTDFSVENQSAGTASMTQIDLQSDVACADFELYSSGYTGTGARQASSAGFIANANATGGISIASQAASSKIRLYTGGVSDTEKRATIDSTGIELLGHIRSGKTTAFSSLSGVAVNIADVAVPSESSTSGEVSFDVELSDGADFSVLRGRFAYAAANKAGTLVVSSAPTVFGSENAASAGAGVIGATATVTTGANSIHLNVVPTWTVFTPTVKNINWRIDSTRTNAITAIP